MLLEAWSDFDREDGDEKSQAEVQTLLSCHMFTSSLALRSNNCFPEE